MRGPADRLTVSFSDPSDRLTFVLMGPLWPEVHWAGGRPPPCSLLACCTPNVHVHRYIVLRFEPGARLQLILHGVLSKVGSRSLKGGRLRFTKHKAASHFSSDSTG